jgi:MoaA/NifB/PqqE/SkfB family radical SAM enzyme
MKIEAIVLKIASRCNLNCSYCYMYNAGDLYSLGIGLRIKDVKIQSHQ